MHDLQGHIIGAMLVLQDITELSKLQRQVASSERHFAVGQMTAGLAHDFNNVLNSISEAVYVLDMKKERSEHDRTMLHVIDTAVRRGSEIVSNIREYLRGNRQIRERLDTSQVLVEALQLAQPLLESRSDIKLVREFGVAAPVEAVPAELRRVFTNLILNAVEAMPQGGTLSLRCGTNGNWIAASISDTGPGIPADKQKMIFSPYFTTKPKGTGLGLAGARRAINSLGGEIRFESSPGRGTTFYVLLPPAKSQATDTISARSA
jgi:two-component system sensor histidine kinase HydH